MLAAVASHHAFEKLSLQNFRATLYKSHPPPWASVSSCLHGGDRTTQPGWHEG